MSSGQGVDIGAQQLAGCRAGRESCPRWMPRTQFLQYLFGGGVLSGLGLLGLLVDFEPFEKNLAHLSGRTHVEGGTGQLVNLLFEFAQAAVVSRSDELFSSAVSTLTPANLHVGEHSGEGHLHLVEELLHLIFGQLLFEPVFQLQGHVGILGGIGGRPARRVPDAWRAAFSPSGR